MNRILIMENVGSVAQLLSYKIRARLQFPVTLAQSPHHARELVREYGPNFFVGLMEWNETDMSVADLVAFTNDLGLPMIVFVDSPGLEVADLDQATFIVDTVHKRNIHEVGYVTGLVHRLYHNRTVKVLVVDDAAFARKHMRNLLERHQLSVVEASNGWQALELLEAHPDIRLAVIDYFMPRMDGLELIGRIRDSHPPDEMAIIGISAHDSGSAPERLLKGGANDFLAKPFSNGEFLCRVVRNLEDLDYLEEIKDAAYRDYLTGLYNRRYFMEAGWKLFANGRRGNIHLCVALIDVDFFKSINDSFGHDVGDRVLSQIAELLQLHLREADLVARFGGEEFCVAALNLGDVDAIRLFEKVRRLIDEHRFQVGSNILRVAVSIGVCTQLGNSLEEMICEADRSLYRAKHKGRNNVVVNMA